MVGPLNEHDLTTKLSTIDYCKTGGDAFEECDHFFYHNMKNAVFGQRKMVYFYVESGKTLCAEGVSTPPFMPIPLFQ